MRLLLGSFLSFDHGELQGRICENTGHIEIAGPDLAGTRLPMSFSLLHPQSNRL